MTDESITRHGASPPATSRERLVALMLPYVAVAGGIWGLRSGWWAFILYHAALLAVLTLTGTWPRALRGFRSTRTDRAAARRLGALGAAAGVLGAVLMWALWPWYAGHTRALLPALNALGLHGATWTAFAIYHALVNPFLEEAYWRGAFGEQRGRVRPSDVAFAGYHAIVLARFTGAGPILLSVLVLTGVAAFWRFTYRRTATLWPATLSHLVADAGVMVVATMHLGSAPSA